MKQKLFGRLAAAAVLLLSAASAMAHDFEVDGIYYNKNSDGTSVSVTYKGSSYSSYSNEYSGAVTIPASVTYSGKTYSVTSIGEEVFRDCSGLESLAIPNSVTAIGDDAFSRCYGLTSVSIGNSVTSIGQHAFYFCSGLTTVEIPNSVTTIGDYAFSVCRGLTEVEIPNSVTTIGSGAFYCCSGLSAVSIGNSVSFIGFGAFWGCSGLTAVEIPNSVTTIGECAFWDCVGLNTIKVQSGNQTYDSRDNCNAIIETASNTLHIGCKCTLIPNSVTSIGNYAFIGCSGLTAVEIPNSVTSIGDSAFENCRGLTAVEIPNSVTTIGSCAFWGCNNLEMVIYNAKNCTGTSSFNGFYSDKEITFVLGAEVEKIGDNILETKYSNRTNYTKKIVSHSAKPPKIENNTFATTSCPLYVPKGAYAKYLGRDVWRNFSNINEIKNPVTKIELNYGAMNLATNSTVQLFATITPDNATLNDIYWSSDAPTVASVDQSGNVTGLQSGTATITAMAIDGSGVKATCLISVEYINAEALTLNPSELTLEINQSAKITPVTTPEIISNSTFEWSTSDANVASFNANSDCSISVLGAADGVATITCRTTDGSNLTATCVVTVGTGAVDGIEADAVTVRGENGVIRIEGADGAAVEVFNASGVCIYSGTATEIPVPQRGLYVVRVAGRATKLTL